MVRRWLLIIILVVTAVSSSLAETHYKPHITIGAKGGATFSEMTFNPSVKQSFLPGMIMGVTFGYAEEKLFGLRAELLVEQRGWKENFEDANPIYNYKRTLTYLQLPILTTITFGPRKFKCIVTLGPEISYMIAGKTTANFDVNNIATLPGFPITNRTNEQLSMEIKNRFDYGISASLGGEWRFNTRNAIAIEGRFYYGLGNIFPDHKKDVFNASRGMSIQVTAGYNFRLK